MREQQEVTGALVAVYSSGRKVQIPMPLEAYRKITNNWRTMHVLNTGTEEETVVLSLWSGGVIGSRFDPKDPTTGTDGATFMLSVTHKHTGMVFDVMVDRRNGMEALNVFGSRDRHYEYTGFDVRGAPFVVHLTTDTLGSARLIRVDPRE